MPRKAEPARGPLTLRQADALRAKLRAAEETLDAIGRGAVDAVVVAGASGARQVYTLTGADKPYRVLIESMHEGAMTLSASGEILYCNARLAALAGRPLERMMGQRFSRFLTMEDVPVFLGGLRASTGPWAAVVRLRTQKGDVPMRLSLTPLDLDGTSAFCAIVTDLSEAYALRQDLQQKDAGLRLAVEAAPAVLFTADSRGRVLSAVGGALKTIRGRIGALLAAPSVGGGKRASARSLRLLAVSTGKAAYDVVYAGRVWNVNLERLGIGGVIGIAVDVSRERRERETASDEARERVQRDYVANVSHEFRTPLAAIRAGAETLLGGALEEKKKARSFVRVIGRQALELSKLVESVLYQAALESGRSKPQPLALDLNGFVRGILKDLGLLASSRGTTFAVSIPQNTTVFADEGQLRRALMSVASNAIKHSPADGRVTVTAEQHDGRVLLSITDAGDGIKAAELPFIFDRFHRGADARRLAIRGTGLGLSLAKALVEANDGIIWAESQPGMGARFNIRLPSRSRARRRGPTDPPAIR